MSVVLDGSACAEYLLGTALGRVVGERLRADGDVHAPHLAQAEVLSVLRGWTLAGELDEPRASAAVRDLRDFPWRLWDITPLLPRVWRLRHNVTAYDAPYVALAEALRCPLLTADARLARAVADPDRVILAGD